MREEMLSAAELETLLEGCETRSNPPAGSAPKQGKPRFELPRMQRLARQQLATLGRLHEDAVERLREALGGLFRADVTVEPPRVDQLRWEQFVEELEHGCCGYRLLVAPLDAHWQLCIPSSLALAMIDRLLGGGKESHPAAGRRLTEIERRLLNRVVGPLAGWLETAWAPVARLQVSVAGEVQEPVEKGTLEVGEPVVRVRLPVTLGVTTGELLLGVPCAALEPLRRPLSLPPSTAALVAKGAGDEPATEHGEAALASVDVTVLLADSALETADLEGLEVGDLITTDHAVGEPLLVCVDGRPAFRAALGSQGGRRAVRILDEV